MGCRYSRNELVLCVIYMAMEWRFASRVFWITSLSSISIHHSNQFRLSWLFAAPTLLPSIYLSQCNYYYIHERFPVIFQSSITSLSSAPNSKKRYRQELPSSLVPPSNNTSSLTFHSIPALASQHPSIPYPNPPFKQGFQRQRKATFHASNLNHQHS